MNQITARDLEQSIRRFFPNLSASELPKQRVRLPKPTTILTEAKKLLAKRDRWTLYDRVPERAACALRDRLRAHERALVIRTVQELHRVPEKKLAPRKDGFMTLPLNQGRRGEPRVRVAIDEKRNKSLVMGLDRHGAKGPILSVNAGDGWGQSHVRVTGSITRNGRLRVGHAELQRSNPKTSIAQLVIQPSGKNLENGYARV